MNFIQLIITVSTLTLLCAGYMFILKKISKIGFIFYTVWFLLFLSFNISTSPEIKGNFALVSTFALLFFVWLILLPPLLYGIILKLKAKANLTINHFYIPLVLLIINLFCIIYFNFTPENKKNFTYEVVENVMNYLNYIVILFFFPVITIYYSFLSFKDNYTNKISNKLIVLSRINSFIICYDVFILLWLINLIIDSHTIKFIFKSFFILYFPLSFYLLLSSKEEKTDESNNLFIDLNQKLIKSLEDEKIFLNVDLNIRKAAKLMGTNEKYLSNTINKIHNQSFSNFINKYRIEYAKKILLEEEYKNHTIESIGNISGFNSKSNFNSSFKNITGYTPTEFRSKKAI